MKNKRDRLFFIQLFVLQASQSSWDRRAERDVRLAIPSAQSACGMEIPMKNLVLIGMPGAGKSTVGVVLEKQQGYHFVDSDLVIQEETGLLLHEIIEQQGDDGFRQVENRINAGLAVRHSVIATGGSVIYGREAMQHLKIIGVVIYLKLSCESIAARLGDLRERGITLREGQTLQQLYDERVPLYERYADITVDCENKSIREIVAEIAARLPK